MIASVDPTLCLQHIFLRLQREAIWLPGFMRIRTKEKQLWSICGRKALAPRLRASKGDGDYLRLFGFALLRSHGNP